MTYIQLITKRIKNFGRLKSAFISALHVNAHIKDGAKVYIHPVVYFKVILRLFSAPLFKLDSLCQPGELRFEKKINKLTKEYLIKGVDQNEKYFDFKYFKIRVPNFKNAEDVLLNDLREVLFENTYGKHFLMGKPINNNDVILDLGANIGVFSLWACTQADNIKCYAVEPHPKIQMELEANIALNMMQNKIIKIEKCISSKNEVLSMVLNEDVFTMTRISNTKGAIQVDAVTIDSLVETLKIEKLDLIKFDIEGAERIAIEGATQTLKNMKPKLALSGYHLVDDAFYLIDKILEIQPKYTVIIGSNMHIYAF